MEDIIINDRITIPAKELDIQFARSGGPGGQNVNKVNSKATLTWDLNTTTALYPTTMVRLRAIAASRITEDGTLQITSQVHREQSRNIQACRDRLKAIILEALIPPTIRRPTSPTKGSERRRRENKKIQSQKKQGRSSSWE